MIFLCFSVKDRVPLINDFYHFLSNFGLDIWYDRRNIFLGDNRFDTNITLGANNSDINYAIVFYSKNFAKGNICIQEYKVLEKRYQNNDLFIFPVFIENVPEYIERKFELCKKLVFKQIKDQQDFLPLCLHIIAKITYDEIQNLTLKNINDIIINFTQTSSLNFKLILEYQNIDKTNYNMRISFLYALYICITHKKSTNYFHLKTMNFIFHQSCLNIIIDEKRELQIMENIIIQEFSTL